jgi:hypothetical protein
MPRIVTFRSRLAIYIYAAPAEHPPPHFHVVGPGTDAVVDLRSLRVLFGRYPKRSMQEVLAWAAANQHLLQARWDELNDRE